MTRSAARIAAVASVAACLAGDLRHARAEAPAAPPLARPPHPLLELPSRLPIATVRDDAGATPDLANLAVAARASTFAAIQENLRFTLHGSMRGRAHALHNLDLDRGLDPAGQPIHPVSSDGGQWWNGADARARVDLAAWAPNFGAAIKARVDVGDSAAVGDPAQSDLRPADVSLSRAWLEATTPLGGLVAGRMGTHLGLGIVAHGGDCLDCDGGAAADRVAWALPVVGHVFAVAWDFAVVKPGLGAAPDNRTIGFAPTDSPDVWSLLVGRFASARTRFRRAHADRVTVEYSAAASYSAQGKTGDSPATTIPRDYQAWALNGWTRVSHKRFRLEAEVAHLGARIGQPSLVPGLELTQEATSSQWGAAVETSARIGRVDAGVNAGWASGDPAPGFGTRIDTARPAGSLDGGQFEFPSDTQVDNFRFSRDYHVDLILFREIIGTVTDARYLRPHARVWLRDVAPWHISAEVAAIASWADQASSTPGQASFLGFELDPAVRFVYGGWLQTSLEGGVFWPGAGFDGGTFPARRAHALRLTAGVVF